MHACLHVCEKEEERAREVAEKVGRRPEGRKLVVAAVAGRQAQSALTSAPKGLGPCGQPGAHRLVTNERIEIAEFQHGH